MSTQEKIFMTNAKINELLRFYYIHFVKCRNSFIFITYSKHNEIAKNDKYKEWCIIQRKK